MRAAAKKEKQNDCCRNAEVADSFFSLIINGIQSVAEKKGYHVLIYLRMKIQQ